MSGGILTAESAADPKLVKPAPEGVFTLRAVRPRVCAGGVRAERPLRLPVFLPPKH